MPHSDRLRGYRRGLLLGFTMSEVMLLLVFALLLSLGVVIKNLTTEQQEAGIELEECRRAVDEFSACPQALAEVERAVMGNIGNDFDEWFTELRLVADKAKKWDRVSGAVTGLADENDLDEWASELQLVTDKAEKWDDLSAAMPSLADETDPEDWAAELQIVSDKAEKWDDLSGAMPGLADKTDPEDWAAELQIVSDKAKKWDDLSAAVPDLAEDADVVNQLMTFLTLVADETGQQERTAQCSQDLEQCNQKQADAEKQVAYWMEKAKAVAGRGGLDYPPCWPATGGKPEYIFEIVILDGGLEVRDIAPEDRRKDLDRFGLDPALYGTRQSAAVFEARTRSVAEHGKLGNCRHFVRIIDRATTKEAYKAQLQAIERHFYKFESTL